MGLRFSAGLATRIHVGLTVLAALFLVFVWGFLAGARQIFPHALFHHAWVAANAYRVLLFGPDAKSAYSPDLWRAPRRAEKGVTVLDRAAAWDGLTLFTSSHAHIAQLVDLDGRVVHAWTLRFEQAWPHPTHIRHLMPSTHIWYRRAHCFPNGDLLAIVEGEGDTPWGYGLVRMDRDSRPIWTYSEHVHHDFDIGPDGRIYTLIHDTRVRPIEGVPQFLTPFIDDSIVVLSAEGRELLRVNVAETLRDSPFAAVFSLLRDEQFAGDVLHVNSISLVRADSGLAAQIGRPGQVLISSRSTSTLAVIDLEARKAVWATRGPWLAQHDPDPLPDGGLLLFDNQGNLGPGGRSRLLEIDPVTLAIRWQYAGTAEHPFYSEVRGEQQRLPNGNTLVTESDGARLFEVTREGRIVWEYLSPERRLGDTLVPVLSAAERYRREDLTFLDAGQGVK